MAFFIENCSEAFFPNGKRYTWRQQTRYKKIPRCIENECVIEKVPRQKTYLWGCDKGRTERCLCQVKDLSEPYCGTGIHYFYVTKQSPYRNENDECETREEIVYTCHEGEVCSDKSGKAECIKTYYDPATEEPIVLTSPSYEVKGLTTAQFVQEYGYSPCYSGFRDIELALRTDSIELTTGQERPATYRMTVWLQLLLDYKPCISNAGELQLVMLTK